LKADLGTKLPDISWTFEPAGQVTVLDGPLPRLDTKGASAREPVPLEKLKAIQDQLLAPD